MKRASDCGLFLLYRAYKAKLSFWNKRDKHRPSQVADGNSVEFFPAIS